MEFRTVSTRLSIDEFTLINDYCRRRKSTPSALIKELLFDELTPSIPAQIAGKNIFEYEKTRDCFIWSVELDTGKKVLVLKNISPEYMEELQNRISNALISRKESLGKRKRDSVPLPRKLIKGKNEYF